MVTFFWRTIWRTASFEARIRSLGFSNFVLGISLVLRISAFVLTNKSAPRFEAVLRGELVEGSLES